MNRRSLLLGMLAAPVIARAGSLMPVKVEQILPPPVFPIDSPYPNSTLLYFTVTGAYGLNRGDTEWTRLAT